MTRRVYSYRICHGASRPEGKSYGNLREAERAARKLAADFREAAIVAGAGHIPRPMVTVINQHGKVVYRVLRSRT